MEECNVRIILKYLFKKRGNVENSVHLLNSALFFFVTSGAVIETSESHMSYNGT